LPVAPVIEPGHTYSSVTDKISAIVLTRPTSLRMGRGFAIFLHHGDGAHYLPRLANHQGRRNLGHQHSVGWGFAIVNFVWWIGIGHAGTLISAILSC